MNHLSRGGFITRSKRSGPTKVVKRRTAALYKKRGHKKTQKRGFFGMGLFGGSPKKRERSASASPEYEELSQHKNGKYVRYNPIYEGPPQTARSSSAENDVRRPLPYAATQQEAVSPFGPVELMKQLIEKFKGKGKTGNDLKKEAIKAFMNDHSFVKKPEATAYYNEAITPLHI